MWNAILARTWLTLLALVLSPYAAFASGVAILDASGTKHFATIQAAVDAAVDGDVLLVAAGTYSGFTIGDKQLSIFVAPENATAIVAGSIVLANSSKDVLVVGFEVRNFGAGAPLDVSSNTGQVRFQDCKFTSIYPSTGAAIVRNSEVVFSNCEMQGYHGLTKVYIPGEDGGAGVEVLDSRVALYACTSRGGHGGDNQSPMLLKPGDGGNGVDLLGNSTAFIAESVLTGGTGAQSWFCSGFPWTCTYGAQGKQGVGVYLSSGSKAFNLGSPATVLGGFITNHVKVLGFHRSFTAPRFSDDEQALGFSAKGLSGEHVFLRYGTLTSFIYFPVQGVWTVNQGGLSFFGSTPLGAIGATGAFNGQITLPSLPQGEVGRRYYLQGYTVIPDGPLNFGPPAGLLSLNRDSLPDCNGNGVGDYLEIIQGLVQDADGNLVPDECEFSTMLYVDAAAAPGGTGTQAKPFQTIGKAIASAGPHGTVVVADGVYFGPDNRNLNMGTKALTVRSANGPDNCIIDCEELGNGFYIIGASTFALATAIEGFTIERGSAPRGGGIYVWGRDDVAIRNCRVRRCVASIQGGGIYVNGERARIEGCVLSRNKGVGGGAYLTRGANIRNCVVELNAGSGLVLLGINSAQPHYLSHSIIRWNRANQGGGVHASDFEDVNIDNCLILGNRAVWGGGIAGTHLQDIRITNSTIVDNQAGILGGGVSASSSSRINIDNTIVWGNAAAQGPQLSVDGSGQVQSTAMNVEYSVIEGGQALVYLDPSALLTWGSGNLVSDPRFEDPSAYDYRLSSVSPAIDAGNNALVPMDLLDIDNDGNTIEPVPLDLNLQARQVEIPTVPDTGVGTPPIVDMGCYERQAGP